MTICPKCEKCLVEIHQFISLFLSFSRSIIWHPLLSPFSAAMSSLSLTLCLLSYSNNLSFSPIFLFLSLPISIYIIWFYISLSPVSIYLLSLCPLSLSLSTSNLLTSFLHSFSVIFPPSLSFPAFCLCPSR